MDDDEIEIEKFEGLEGLVPTSFGKQTGHVDAQRQVDRSKRTTNSKPALKDKNQADDGGNDSQSDQSSSDDDDDDDSDSDDEDEFPVSHEMVIKTHDRPVTTTTIDPSGSRIITGSMDCTLKLHDFASLTPTTIRAFKSVDPSATKASSNVETHPIHQAVFNPISPSQVLVITASPQPRLISRDGDVQSTFVKGDMYLRDMHNTKGHISEVTSCAWHPTSRDLCVTAGTDSTLRIWDLNNLRSQKDVIVQKSKAAGSAGRTKLTAVAWGSPAQGASSLLVAAAYDGTLAMWNGDGPFNRPSGDIREAHESNTWTTGLDISADGRLIVSRGGDDTIKLWDTRKFSKPITSAIHPSTSATYPTSNIRFSPNSSNIITGSATGHLHILTSATLKPELVTPVTPGSAVITTDWHPKLNQIVAGCANGETHLLYNPNTSTGGAKLVMSKAPKRRHIDDDPNLTMDLSAGISGEVMSNSRGGAQASTSFAARHPEVGFTASGKSRDPRRPHIPAATPFAKGQPDENQIQEHIPLSSMRNEDPREALLKYADKVKDDPIFTKAWKDTQPKTVYSEYSDDDDHDEQGPDKKKAKRF